MANEDPVVILLVEDDVLFASTIAEYLVDNGIEVRKCNTVEDALQFDLDGVHGAIIDVMLPNDPSSSGIPSVRVRPRK